MTSQSITADVSRRISHVVFSGRNGVSTDLALLLSADALSLVFAFLAWMETEQFPRALTTLGALSVISLALIVFFAMRHYDDMRSQGFLILQAGFAYWYLVPMLLTAVRGQVYLAPALRSFTAFQVGQGCVAVLLAKFTCTFVYQLMLIRPICNIDHLTAMLNHRTFRLPIMAVAVQLALGLLPFILSGRPLLTAILGSRSGEGVFPKSNFGTQSVLFGFTFFLMSCCLLGLGTFLLDHNQSRKWLFLLLGLTAFVITAFALSTRTTLLAVVMPMLSTYVTGSPDRWRTAKVVICLVALWFGADVLVYSRASGKGFLEGNAFRRSAVQSANLVDNDFYGELLYAIEVVPDQVAFSYESPIIYAAVTFIPRSMWPGKPMPLNADRAMRIRLNDFSTDFGGSLLPGIIGQYWLAAGWIGLIIGGAWLGAGVSLADRILNKSNWHIRYLAFGFFWAIFISFRTLALSNLLPMLLCAFTVLVLSRPNRVIQAKCVSR